MAEDDNSLQFDSQPLPSSPDSENNLQDCSLVFTESQAADSDVTQPPSDHVSESPHSSISQSPQPSTSHQVTASKDIIEVSSSEEESQSVILKKRRKLTGSSSSPLPSSPKLPEENLELDKAKKHLKERRETVKKLQDVSKHLKRKCERLSEREQASREKKQKIEQTLSGLRKDAKTNKKQIHFLKTRLGHFKKKGDKYMKMYIEKNREVKRLQQKIASDSVKLSTAGFSTGSSEQEKAETEICHLKTQSIDQQITIDYLRSLLDDSSELELRDKDSRSYTPDTVQCVMNLTNLKVATEKVGKVIREVASLCGKTPNAVPSASTVNRIVHSKLSVAQEQLKDVLKEQKNTTLYTDETRKYGKTVETYVLTDETQTSYILGLREMANKSSQTTLDTFKEILEDINSHCHIKEKEGQMHEGYHILANIRDTMSDRASTEKAFNRLLEEFRETILPQVVDGWADLDEKERTMCSKMNNFFCGLHLLVGMADSCEETLKTFEHSFLENKPIGSSKFPELKMFHKSESGTLRIIRTCCKAFALGEDEKNGVSLAWKTFLKNESGERNRFVRFKHNRFNLVFSLGHAVYYHHEDISKFLDTVHGTTNSLLKAVSYDIKEDLYLAGARALGLISKFISGPLWKLLEAKGHILEMNSHYKNLVDFLEKGSNDVAVITDFIRGDNTPFDTRIDEDDKVVTMLTAEDQSVDQILCPLLQSLFKTIYQLLSRMVTDHLPGGKFWNPEAQVVEETRSTMAHNKLPEFVFGQLDQLLRYRPNSTLLTNESFLMYSHNRTREWLDSLEESVRDKLITDSRKGGAEIWKKFRSRLNEIEEKRLDQQRKRQKELEEKEQKRLKAAEDLTNDVCYYGLWQSEEQVDEGLTRLSEREQRKAIESQLKFRKQVLKQKYKDAKIFSFSKKNEAGKYIKHCLEDLRSNLLVLIKATMTMVTTEQHQEGIPLFVGKHIEHTFHDGVYQGYVISVVPGFPKWYNVKYENDPAVYAYNLCEDFEKEDVKIVVKPHHQSQDGGD